MPVPSGNQICICTIEKANSIVNQLIEEGRLDEVGCVVVDEVRKWYHNLNTINLVLTSTRYDKWQRSRLLIGTSAYQSQVRGSRLHSNRRHVRDATKLAWTCRVAWRWDVSRLIPSSTPRRVLQSERRRVQQERASYSKTSSKLSWRPRPFVASRERSKRTLC